MHIRKLLLAVTAVSILAFATFSGGLMGQGLVDGIKVTLPHPVTVGDKVLDPGEYEIRRASSVADQIVKIFNNDKMVYETNVLTIPNEAKDTPEESKVILHHIGDKYYFDKIWIHGKDTAWEFPLPSRARAEQREIAETIPARYEPQQLAEVVQSETPNGLAAELDALASQQDREQQAALAESERANREERERQAALDRQAELDRLASLRVEPAPSLPTERSEAEAIAPAPEPQSESPEQLPETATNWLSFVIGGILLVTASFFLRPARAEG